MDYERYCPICENIYGLCCGPRDGPSNGTWEDWPEFLKVNCVHKMCMGCWRNIYNNSVKNNTIPRCPFCNENITNWICYDSAYTDEDEDKDHIFNKNKYIKKYLEDIKDDVELLNIFKTEINDYIKK